MARSTDRRAHMEAMLTRLGIANMRVNALDARDPAAQQQVIKRSLEIMAGGTLNTERLPNCTTNPSCVQYTNALQFCSASHISAIATYVQTSSNPYAIIAEDDVSFEEFAPFWRQPLRDYLEELPADWEVAQLMVALPHVGLGGLQVTHWQAHTPRANWWGAVCYMIKREVAQKLVAAYVDNEGRIDLRALGDRNIWSELVVYGAPVEKVYAMPLVSVIAEGSTLEHASGGAISRKKIRPLWMEDLVARRQAAGARMTSV